MKNLIKKNITLMKKIFVFLCIGSFLFSCKKSTTVNNNVPVSYLSSVRTYNSSASHLTIDSFEYDGNHDIAKYLQYLYDTNTVSNTTILDSDIITFSFASNSLLPTSYTSFDGSFTAVDLLYYDAQNRIIKDTCISNSSPYVINLGAGYFSYPNNEIVVAFDSLYMPSVNWNMIDTLFLNNNNVIGQHVYDNYSGEASVYSFNSLASSYKNGFSNVTNPGYYPNVAKTIGPLLFVLSSYSIPSVIGFVDFISGKLTSSTSVGSNTVYTNIINTDSQGRVTQLSIGSDNKVLFSYY